MRKQALDHFGELLMQKVRDESIEQWDKILDGRMHDPFAQRVRDSLAEFDAHQLEVLRWLVPQVVDVTLHHLLWMFDQTRSVDVAVKTPEGIVPSIRDVSDGLAGEPHGDHGWISRFSKERHEESWP